MTVDPATLCMSEMISATCTRARLRRWILVSELVRRVDGVVDGLRPLVDVARGSAGGVCGDVFEEVKERFAHPSVRVHHERDEFLMHRRGRRLVLVVIVSLAFS